MEKIIYYEDELNDEFSSAQIDIRTIDENYVFIHGINVHWLFKMFLACQLSIYMRN